MKKIKYQVVCPTVAGLDRIEYETDNLTQVIDYWSGCPDGKIQTVTDDSLLQGGVYWKVQIECIDQVVLLSPNCDGVFIAGQDELWGFGHVQKWIEPINFENTSR